jgi:transcription initiation factor TFIID subunit TAF12
MGLAAAAQQQLNNNASPQTTFSSPSPNIQGKANQANAAQAAVAAAAAVKNNGMFSFPANQTPTTPVIAPNTMIPGPKPVSAPSMDTDGVNRVLTKRKIQELVTQIDPSERLEPEVEDVSCVILWEVDLRGY